MMAIRLDLNAAHDTQTIRERLKNAPALSPDEKRLLKCIEEAEKQSLQLVKMAAQWESPELAKMAAQWESQRKADEEEEAKRGVLKRFRAGLDLHILEPAKRRMELFSEVGALPANLLQDAEAVISGRPGEFRWYYFPHDGLKMMLDLAGVTEEELEGLLFNDPALFRYRVEDQFRLDLKRWAFGYLFHGVASGKVLAFGCSFSKVARLPPKWFDYSSVFSPEQRSEMAAHVLACSPVFLAPVCFIQEQGTAQPATGGPRAGSKVAKTKKAQKVFEDIYFENPDRKLTSKSAIDCLKNLGFSGNESKSIWTASHVPKWKAPGKPRVDVKRVPLDYLIKRLTEET